MSLRIRKGASSADLGVLALRKLPVLPLQLFCDLVSHLLASIFDHSLDNAAGVVLEHNILDLAAYDVHECIDLFRAFLFRQVFLPSECPRAFCVGQEDRMWLRGFSLRENSALFFV